MTFPFFYIQAYAAGQKEIELDEDTSRHVIQVLRMKSGEVINLTDGKGNLLTCSISEEHKKHCVVAVDKLVKQPAPARKVSIAISLLKNANRFEWFLEKATEIGVNEIVPLICERTEKEKFRYDRMHAICVSAMLQSQQVFLPLLHDPLDFHKWVLENKNKQRLIAHCEQGSRTSLDSKHIGAAQDCVIAIGPEGDFSQNEITLALQNEFIPVSLGETRLRTETAGVVAAARLLN